MSPNPSSSFKPSGVLSEGEAETADGGLLASGDKVAAQRSYQLVWRNIFMITILHIFGFFGLWAVMNGRVKWQSNVFGRFR
jgi:hypothetical protein